jgi:hypothetical protein
VSHDRMQCRVPSRWLPRRNARRLNSLRLEFTKSLGTSFDLVEKAAEGFIEFDVGTLDVAMQDPSRAFGNLRTSRSNRLPGLDASRRRYSKTRRNVTSSSARCPQA